MTLLNLQEILEYEIIPKVISLEESEKRGFGAIASAYMDLGDYTNKMGMWEDLYNCKELGRHIVFHEFTHIFGAEKYVKKR